MYYRLCGPSGKTEGPIETCTRTFWACSACFYNVNRNDEHYTFHGVSRVPSSVSHICYLVLKHGSSTESLGTVYFQGYCDVWIGFVTGCHCDCHHCVEVAPVR